MANWVHQSATTGNPLRVINVLFWIPISQKAMLFKYNGSLHQTFITSLFLMLSSSAWLDAYQIPHRGCCLYLTIPKSPVIANIFENQGDQQSNSSVLPIFKADSLQWANWHRPHLNWMDKLSSQSKNIKKVFNSDAHIFVFLKLKIITTVAGLEAFVIVTETRIVFKRHWCRKYSSLLKDKGVK